MVAPLETGRIHALPVQVTYHLSSSSQSFCTLFETPQDVYLHPTAGKSKNGDDEVWGAIYLKAVIQGIVTASPELHPAHPGTPDLSLYLLDPRETFFKRLRSGPQTRSRSAAGFEVWAGRGLVSGALSEADKGKSLVTGRLVRRAQFLNVTPPQTEGMSALEALMAANSTRSTTEIEAWGIEISVGLKAGLSLTAFPGPLHHTVENCSVTGIAEPEEEDILDSPARTPVRPHSVARIPSFPAPRTVSSSSSLPPRAIPRHHSSSSPAGPSRGRTPIVRKRVDERSRLSNVDMNMGSSSPAINASNAAQIFNGLTDDQKRVLTPDILSFLEKLAGTHGAQVVANEKRAREEDTVQSDSSFAKRPRNYGPRSEMSSTSTTKGTPSECSNCGTTKSSVWRQQQMPNGETLRVCNACGLYYQKKSAPRPPSMWTHNDDGVPRRGRGKTAERKGKELKRTMTQAVEKDAARIASSRRKSAPRGKTPAMINNAPQTSPSRGSAPLPRAVRVAAATSVAGSSPAGSSVWHGDETPGSTSNGFQPMQSLAMPLSDDGSGNHDSPAMSWAGDLSAFFNVEGFDASPDSDNSPSRPGHQAMSSMDARNVSSALRNQMVIPTSDAVDPSDDDAFSNLFQRTSSFGRSSSVGVRSSSFQRSSSFGPYEASPHEKFDFSQLPPSSPPALPSNLPHSALLFSSPSGSTTSPVDPSPRDQKQSPGTISGLRNEVTAGDDKSPVDGIELQDILAKLNNADVMALFSNLPAA